MAARDISRRRFLQLAAMAAAIGALPRAVRALPGLPAGLQYDDGSSQIPGPLAGTPDRVIVVGAGFAGLAVANALAVAGVECVVIEGRGRIGGRAFTASVGGTPIDLGCAWVTDPVRNPMTTFAAQSGIAMTPAEIELDIPTGRFYDARTGIVPLDGTLYAVGHVLTFEDEVQAISNELGPLASAMDGIVRYLDDHGVTDDPRRRAEYFLRLVVEGENAADADLQSLAALAEYDSPYIGIGQGDFPVGGYSRLVDSLGGGAVVRLGHRVTHIAQDGSGVRVTALDPDGAPVTEYGSHVVVTVPLGVLKDAAITFDPGLPAAKQQAIAGLGMGTAEKVIMRFPEPYWATEHTHIFHLSHPDMMQFPLFVDYWHLEKVPVLLSFNTASNAIAFAGMSDADIAARQLEVLRAVQGGPVPEPTDVVITRWGPDEFSRGSYSYVAVGSTKHDQTELGEPVGRILFAGEASNVRRYGYADGAFTTGIREAKRLLQQPSVEIRAHAGIPAL